ncbi:MAG: indolepyruvate oxidoreductase subunit beta [Clostridiaceae bacterium]|nr:indolepyruvate oxidoreductase subunit beta [Clostridiaceae bacterium]
MRQTKNVLCVGVGGQGTILASKILTQGLIKSGYDVKMSEVHGMAQRGGSVTTQVRFGDKVYSPLVEKGKVDVIVSFEKSETARYLTYLKKDGHIVVNDYEIHSLPVLMGKEKYPKNINEKLTDADYNTIIIKAAEIAKNLGNIRAQNVVLLGALIKILNLESINWDEVISDIVPAKAVDINKKAFSAGKDI